MKNTILIIGLFLIASLTFAQSKTDKEPTQTSKPTNIVFKSTVYDFGTIEYKEDAKGEFIFKNISKEDVLLTNVKASCGCTGTEWPREEIKRRKKATIYVSYDTKRVGKFKKNVYVYVDGNPNPIQLEIKGEVLKAKDGASIKTTTKTISPDKVKINGNVKSEKPNGKSSKTSSNTRTIESEDNTIKKTAIKKEEKIESQASEKSSVRTKSE